jgi:hypothetical protein
MVAVSSVVPGSRTNVTSVHDDLTLGYEVKWAPTYSELHTLQYVCRCPPGSLDLCMPCKRVTEALVPQMSSPGHLGDRHSVSHGSKGQPYSLTIKKTLGS